MPIPFTCPHCGARTEVAEMYAGQTGPCARCSKTITVPVPGGVVTPQKSSAVKIVLIVVAVFGVMFFGCSILAFVSLPLMMERPPNPPDPALAEIGNLDMAVKAFKEKYGEYPPDGTDPAAVKRFVNRTFPRYTGPMPDTGDPARSLVFWLSGIGSDPTNPFDKSGVLPMFDFDPARLRGGMYYPPQAGANAEPYVYFRAKAGRMYAGQYQVPGGSLVRPCKDCRFGGFANPSFANPTSFQIRAPGRDGRYGSGVDFPGGADYDQYQYDDLSNFATGTFKDNMS